MLGAEENESDKDYTFAKITGIITSDVDNQAIIGANIIVKGTNRGTVSDIDGSFEIEANCSQ